MAEWTPAELGAVTWHKADAITALNDADPVATWEDSGPGDNDATEATNRPTYRTNVINSLPIVRFDGTNDVLTIADVDVNGQPFSVAAVATPPAANKLISGNAATAWFAFRNVNAAILFAGSLSASFATLSGSDFHIFLAVFSSSTSIASYDGTTTASLNPGTNFPASAWTMGENLGSGTYGGDIAEHLIMPGAWDTDTRQLIEGYLAHKYGLEANLPADHPYKAAAPTLGGSKSRIVGSFY